METWMRLGGIVWDRIFVYICRRVVPIVDIVFTLIHFPAIYTPAWTTARVVSYYVHMRYLYRPAYPSTPPRPRTTYDQYPQQGLFTSHSIQGNNNYCPHGGNHKHVNGSNDGLFNYIFHIIIIIISMSFYNGNVNTEHNHHTMYRMF